ncbi:MAG: AAA family ATPase [Actinobacteria bacterium]|nr:AAA family ATPase [Actinomycetota bacterium]
MIIWINGPFGVGKTTTARRLVKRVPNSTLINVEKIGSLIRGLVPRELRSADWQHDPLWPDLNVRVLTSLDRRAAGPIVVPMTLWEPLIFDGIVGELRSSGIEVRHFALMAPLEVLTRRMRKHLWIQPSARAWRRAMAEPCLQALKSEQFALHVDASGPVDVVVDTVLTQSGLVEER